MIKSKFKGFNFLYVFFPDDFERWSRRFKFNSLLRNNPDCRIIGIRYPISLGTLISNPVHFFSLLFRLRERITTNLWAITFLSIVPVSFVDRNKILSFLNRGICLFQMTIHLKSIEKTDKKQNVLWISAITKFPFCFQLKNSFFVYDCLDELTMNQEGTCSELKIIEDEMLKKSDVVFTASRYLYEKKRIRTRRCFYFPHGVDPVFFCDNKKLHLDMQAVFSIIKRPIVGYVGNIRSWLDFDLLVLFAQRFSMVSFVFVGSIMPDVKQDIKRLKEFPNVFFIGRQEYEQIPSVVRMFDVTLIPFKINTFNFATNPYKFMEYLALGKPVLSPNIVELRQFSDVLVLYESQSEAIEKLERLFQTSEKVELVNKRIEIARRHIVDTFSRQQYEILNKLCSVTSED